MPPARRKTPAQSNFDLAKIIGAAVTSAVMAATSVKYGEKDRVKAAVNELIEYRTTENEKNIALLKSEQEKAVAGIYSELRPFAKEFIEVKTGIKAGLERVIEKSEEARKTSNESSRDIIAVKSELRSEIESLREACRKCTSR